MKNTLQFAFKKTIPIAFGYIFLGMAFGVVVNEAGYGVFYAFLSSLFVYAGAMQFVAISLVAAGAPLITVAVMTLFVNARHLFYGIGFIEKFREMGWRYPYMVLSLTDETYSVLCSCQYPKEADEKNAGFFIAVLNQFYWVAGSVLGALIGTMLPFNAAGIEFSMTALFVVIFLDQWKQFPSHLPAIAGFAAGLIFLVLLGPENFLLPALAATIAALCLLKKQIERKSGGEAV